MTSEENVSSQLGHIGWDAHTEREEGEPKKWRRRGGGGGRLGGWSEKKRLAVVTGRVIKV